MRFQVPQFIEIEDKIFGPLTIKQFVYLAGGAGLITTFFMLLPSFVAFVLSIPVVGLSTALAFYKPQGRSFILILEAGFKYILSNKLYIWKKENKKIKKKEVEEEPLSDLYIPKLSDSKLSDLSWSLDIKEKLTDEINNN